MKNGRTMLLVSSMLAACWWGSDTPANFATELSTGGVRTTFNREGVGLFEISSTTSRYDAGGVVNMTLTKSQSLSTTAWAYHYPAQKLAEWDCWGYNSRLEGSCIRRGSWIAVTEDPESVVWQALLR